MRVAVKSGKYRKPSDTGNSSGNVRPRRVDSSNYQTDLFTSNDSNKKSTSLLGKIAKFFGLKFTSYRDESKYGYNAAFEKNSRRMSDAERTSTKRSSSPEYIRIY